MEPGGPGAGGVGLEEATTMTQGLEPACWEERLRVGVVQPGEEKAAGRTSCSLSTYKRDYKKDGGRLFTKVCSDRRKGNSFKLEEGRLRLGVRKKLFTLRMVRPWPRLPREVGDAPSLEPFQARLDGALSTLIWLEMSLPMAGGWTGWPRKVPSHPNQSVSP